MSLNPFRYSEIITSDGGLGLGERKAVGLVKS